MRCIICSKEIKIIRLNNESIDERISRLCDAELENRIFNVCSCPNDHITIECRYCRKQIIAFNDDLSYVTSTEDLRHCMNDLKYPEESQCVWLSIHDMLLLMPQISMLYIDYTSVFRQTMHDFVPIKVDTKIIYGLSDEMHDIVNIIKKQEPVKCKLCYQTYESFPSLNVAIEHYRLHI